jgi:hypothetical protein
VLEGKVVAELLGDERMQVTRARSAREKIDSASSQRAGARSRQNEAASLRFDESMHFIEQRRNLLDLVEDDRRLRIGRYQSFEAVRRGVEAGEEVDIEQVEIDRLRKVRSCPDRLSGSAGTEEEETVLPIGRQQSGIHDSISHFNLEFTTPK